MNAFSFVQYVVLAQLDALAEIGAGRVMAAFGNIAGEADEYAEKMFDSYAGIGDPGDFAEEARDQGAAYYSMLAELRQSMLNLIAVGMYHLYEQHRAKLRQILGRSAPKFEELPGWNKIDELRLVANTVKHADGGAARQLRGLRPNLFVSPILWGSPMGEHALCRATENPLGGTDLFVSETDLGEYRDALRAHWESVRSLL